MFQSSSRRFIVIVMILLPGILSSMHQKIITLCYKLSLVNKQISSQNSVKNAQVTSEGENYLGQDLDYRCRSTYIACLSDTPWGRQGAFASELPIVHPQLVHFCGWLLFQLYSYYSVDLTDILLVFTKHCGWFN